MSSPIPPDPYEALGVSKDVDISAIRTAHRKLVLKHHPDRISDPALKEKGQHLFTEIQQAYELLSDPVRRTRYDDKIKLAELRKEAMMRDGPRHAYPMRPAPHSASSSRDFSADDGAYYETRRPRESDYFDSKESFEAPNRTTSRKYADYDRASTTKRPEKSERSAKATWNVAAEAVKFGIRVKKEAEKARTTKTHQTRQETRDREKRSAKEEKDRRAYVVDEADSDSDAATHVTASTVRASKSVPRHESSSARSSGAYTQRRAYTDDDSDTATNVSSLKWERGHFEGAMEYMQKAAGRPSMPRGESFWGSKKGGSDSEKPPTSARGRRGGSYGELPIRPPMPTQSSAPGNLKVRTDDRAPREAPREATREKRSATGSYPDHRKEMPAFSRSQTMPAQKPSPRKDAAPSKSSNLKHSETHDSGYGSTSSAHTPEMREQSPPRRPTMAPRSSTKYKIVDPSESDDDRATTIRVLDDEVDRRRYQRSPERDYKESARRREKDRGERPRVETRSKSSREPPIESPKLRRNESSKYRDEPRSSRESTRDEPPSMNRHNSGRERERLYAELSDEEKPYRYKYPSGDKINMRSQYPDPQFAKYREPSDRRSYDYSPNSRYPEGFSSSRRPSVQAHG